MLKRTIEISSEPFHLAVRLDQLLLKRNGDAGRIQAHLPPDGEVRVITITDKQFEGMLIFWGKVRKQPQRAPEQLTLF